MDKGVIAALFWILVATSIGLLVYWAIKGRMYFNYLILSIAIIAFTGVGNDLLWYYFNYAYFTEKAFQPIYHTAYEYLIYPTSSIVFIKTLKHRNIYGHIAIWCLCMSLIEWFLSPIGVVRYRPWMILPHTLVLNLVIVSAFWLMYKSLVHHMKKMPKEEKEEEAEVDK